MLSGTIRQKSGGRLFDKVMRSRDLKPSWTPSRLLAFLIAGGVHGLTVAAILMAIGFSAVTYRYSLCGPIISLILLVLIWLWLIPRPSAAPGEAMSREAFPTLYSLSDGVAQTLGGKPVQDIRWDLRYNAAFGQFGWQRKRTLMLGLPLLAVLDGQELVALLGHELAHQVNGDPSRGFFIGGAFEALGTWYELIDPSRRWHVRTGLAWTAVLMFLVNLLSQLVTGIIRLVAFGLIHLLWDDMQRSEYLADGLAAQMSGSEAMLAMLRKIQLYEAFQRRLMIAYHDGRDRDFFTDLKCYVAGAPPREFERIRRNAKHEDARMSTTHPPMDQRLAVLQARPAGQPKIVLSLDEAARLESELRPLFQAAQQSMFALDSISFRRYFGLNW
jgi:Zn-dependent protease with chaperone function